MNKPTGKLRLEVTRPYVPLMTDLFVSGYAHPENYKKMFLCDFYGRIAYIDGKWYYGPEAREFGELMYQKHLDKSGFILEVFENIYQIGNELLALSGLIKKKNYAQLSEKETLQDFIDFTNSYKVFALSLMGYNIQFPIERELRKILEGVEGVDDTLSTLTFPRKKNFAVLEQESLFEIGTYITEGGSFPKSFIEANELVKNNITAHIAEYGWINTRGGLGEPWTGDEILDRIRNLGPNYSQKLSELREHPLDAEKKTKAFFTERNTPSVAALIDTAKELVYYRTYRTDYLNKIFFNIRNLLLALATSRNIPLDSFMHMRVEEIIKNTEISTEEIFQRKEGFALYTVIPTEVKFSSNSTERRRVLAEYCETETVETKELKGSIANKGVVRGMVKIVRSKHDAHKVNKGDIIVAPMTTPDMIPAMSLASAFVTDEGGITCHAAIVSREMKRPCIIGTKFATQVLKDGDLVEVDANEGVVRVIEKAKS